jgi:polyhydroxyalkanoate synthesis regulator phasin
LRRSADKEQKERIKELHKKVQDLKQELQKGKGKSSKK